MTPPLLFPRGPSASCLPCIRSLKGVSSISTIMTSILSLLLLSTVLVLTAVYFIPFLGHRLGRTLGWYIRRRTSDRRAHLLTRAASDEEEHAEQLRHPKAVEDEDWETVESHAAGSAKNGGKAEEDWEGIIGFFHPFW